MTGFIEQAIVERRLGLALHYPLIDCVARGLNARNTFEFGAGGSTNVFLEAHRDENYLGWRHFSLSTEAQIAIELEHEGYMRGCGPENWLHRHARSDEARDMLPDGLLLDLVLHDGSHAAAVVAADIAWIWPHLRRCGLLLVHDTQHSYCGAEVRAGLTRGLAGARFTATTLPYGFGLTIVRREDGDEVVSPATAKATSLHSTIPCSVELTP